MDEELSTLIQPSNNRKIEFRLYYDELGNPIAYSAENPDLPHKYIVIDALTYSLCRFDIKVIDEKIVTDIFKKVVLKYKPSDNEGISCSADDISIIVNPTTTNKKWKLHVNEY